MELLALLLFVAVIISLILPWVNMVKLTHRKTELAQLEKEIHLQRLTLQRLQKQQVPQTKAPSPSAQTTPETAKPPPLPTAPEQPDLEVTVQSSPSPTSAKAPEIGKSAETDPAPTFASAQAHTAKNENTPFQQTAAEEKQPQDWFSRIAVWVGAVALLMAGFYMVKYSIDSGWLTPAVRVWLTAIFGAGLCLGGFVISIKSTLKGNERIGQALSGAGVACLYFAAYAAVHLYTFLNAKQGFGCMIAVTLLAVGLSLKNGAPIALIGLIGGFLTPWLMSTGSNDTAMLFGYLFLLVCGAQYLCIRRQWWGLLLGSIAGAYLWSTLVIASNLTNSINNLEGTMLFILGMCVLNAIWTCLKLDSKPNEHVKMLMMIIRIIAWGGGLIQAMVLVLISEFAGVDMALFAVLSIGALSLAVLREDDFMWATWLALGTIAVGTLANPDTYWLSWFAWPTGLLLLFFVVGHLCRLNATRSKLWGWASVIPMVLLTPLLYLNNEVIHQRTSLFEGCWMVIASFAALLLILASEHLRLRTQSNTDHQDAVGENQCIAFFIFAFGLWTYVPSDYFAHSLAGLLIAATVYWKWRNFTHSGWILGGLAGALTISMLPLAGEALAYFFRETFIAAEKQNYIAVIAWALSTLSGVTAIACFGKTWQPNHRMLLAWWSGLTTLFGLVASYQWVAQSLMPESWTSAAIEGGLTSLLAILAVGCSIKTQRWSKLPFASPILISLVAVRITILHLGDSGAAGESFFMNALFWQWGIPFVATCSLAWMASEHNDQRLRQVYQTFAMILGFIWSTFLVQDYFGSSYLIGGTTSNTELYTYSVVWLVVAIAYQAIGLWRNQKVIHIGSLILLILTVGKVFLVDASELEGLFRVLSFLGLGTSLIGIGFFYNKVVFAREQKIDTA